MNKKGFVFMETIITIVILSSSLLLIYSSFKNLIVKQKSRIYYDDVVYTYRTWQECFKNKECNDINPELRKYISTISIDFDCSNILIIEYKTCNKDNCQNFYSWVGA